MKSPPVRALVATASLGMTLCLAPAVSPTEPASAAGQATRTEVTQQAAHHPFRIKVGKIYYINSHLTGIRRGDRLGLRARRQHRKGFYFLGSWRLHAHQRLFSGRVFAKVQGWYHLQTYILRHHRPLRGSYSNVFGVRVIPHYHRVRPPQHALDAAAAVASSGWTDVYCGADRPGTGEQSVVIVPPPFWYAGSNQQELINEVAFTRDAQPGGTWSNWYAATNYEENVYPEGYDPNGVGVSLFPGSDATRTDPNINERLWEMSIQYSGYHWYHQITWDWQVYTNNGWVWIDPNWIVPDSYIQSTPTEGPYTSSTCETFGQ